MMETFYSKKLIENVEIQLEQYFEPKDKKTVLCTVSGGADSVCLLYIFTILSKKYNYNIKALHVHHGIRQDEADRDEAFVKNLCDTLNVEYFCERIDVPKIAKEIKKSEEETARILRYECFDKVAKWTGADKIALAHNANDVVETFLFNLARGTNIRGLMGIPKMRDRYIRPLLNVERREIEEFLRENNLQHVEDSTNKTNAYTRNKIRNIVLPSITENINERAAEHINNTVSDLNNLYELAVLSINKIKDDVLIRIDDGSIEIDTNKAGAYKKEYLSYALNELIRDAKLKAKDMTRANYDDIYKLCLSKSPKKIDLPNNISARAAYGSLIIENRKNENIETDKIFKLLELKNLKTGSEMSYNKNSINFIFTRINIDSFEKSFIKNIGNNGYEAEYFDFDRLCETDLMIRTVKKDDFMVISRNGKGKKVNRILIDAKIPRDDREYLPVVAYENRVLYIPKVRRSMDFLVDENTRSVLRVEYFNNRYVKEEL